MFNNDNKIISQNNQHTSTFFSSSSLDKNTESPSKTKDCIENKNSPTVPSNRVKEIENNERVEAEIKCKSTQPNDSCSHTKHIDSPKEKQECSSLTFKRCGSTPPKLIRDIPAEIQLRKSLTMKRARLLAHSVNPESRKESQKLFQCSRYVRITKSGKPLYWRCKSRNCYICNFFKQREYVRNFKTNLTKSRYAPNKWMMITFTIPNTSVDNLSKTIRSLNSNFRKLNRRKSWSKSVDGWIKAIEFPREQEDPNFFNAHLHILVAMNESAESNKLFKTEPNGVAPLLTKIWSRYTGGGLVFAKDISKRRNNDSSEKFSWISPDQIDPDELSEDVISYLTKNVQTDLDEFEHPYPTKHTFDFIKQTKGLRLFSCGGTLSGFLSPPPKRKLTDKEKEEISKQYSPSNIAKTFLFHSKSNQYKPTKEERSIPHYEAWLIFKYKSFHLSTTSQYLTDMDHTYRIKEERHFSLICRDLEEKCKDDS